MLINKQGAKDPLQGSAGGASPYQRVNYQHYVLFLLGTAYAFNLIDRQLLSILQESVKSDLQLSDTQLGLLTGFAFALFYVLAGIPIARWADRSNRRNIISMAVGVWSLMTALSGAAANFVQLLLIRIGVGVGEAGCSPPAHSMISDIFPPEKRGTAIGLYSVGVNVGILFGFFLGGVLNEYFGWRLTFLIIGVPGLLLALVIRFTVAEPTRGWSENKQIATETIPLKQVARYILRQSAVLHLCFAASLTALATYGVISWSASFYIRVHNLGTAELGIWLALSSGVFGGIGTFLAGYISDRLGGTDKRWYMWVPALSILLSVPPLFFILTTGDVQAALWVNLIPGLLMSSYIGPSVAMLHTLVEPRMRALASAIFFFVVNIVGLGIGSSLIGVVSDLLAAEHGVMSLPMAMLYVIPVACVWSCLHYLLAARSIKRTALN